MIDVGSPLPTPIEWFEWVYRAESLFRETEKMPLFLAEPIFGCEYELEFEGHARKGKEYDSLTRPLAPGTRFLGQWAGGRDMEKQVSGSQRIFAHL